MKTVILASSNAGKLQEFNTLFQDFALQFVPQSALNIMDAEETAVTFLENALLKARHAAAASGHAALADDSGLCVPALQGRPGVYSARFAGVPSDDQKNNLKLLQEMQHLEGPARRAYFCCTLVFIEHAADPMPLIFQGQWWGEILKAPQGENGFGYDPLFYVPTLQKTAAELAPDIKNQLSHRGQAVAKMLAHWQAQR